MRGGVELLDEPHLEAIADAWRARSLAEPPIDGAVELVAAGCVLVADPTQAAGRGCVLGRTVFYSPSLPEDVLNFTFLHELGHLLARRAGCDSEQAASYIAAAIAIPRAQLKRVVRRVGWDIPFVRWAFGDCVSHEVVGRRLVDVYPELVLSVWLGGRLVVRYVRGELSSHERRVSQLELAAIGHAVAAGEPGWRARECVGAWTVQERRGLMTFVLADRDAIERDVVRRPPSLIGPAVVGEERVEYDDDREVFGL